MPLLTSMVADTAESASEPRTVSNQAGFDLDERPWIPGGAA